MRRRRMGWLVVAVVDRSQLEAARADVERDQRLVWQRLIAHQQLDADTAAGQEVRQGVLVVPSAVVQRGPAGAFAWPVGPGGNAAERGQRSGTATGPGTGTVDE